MKAPFSQTSKTTSWPMMGCHSKNDRNQARQSQKFSDRIEIDLWVKSLSVYRSFANPQKFYCYLNGYESCVTADRSPAQTFKGFASIDEMKVSFVLFIHFFFGY